MNTGSFLKVARVITVTRYLGVKSHPSLVPSLPNFSDFLYCRIDIDTVGNFLYIFWQIYEHSVSMPGSKTSLTRKIVIMVGKPEIRSLATLNAI